MDSHEIEQLVEELDKLVYEQEKENLSSLERQIIAKSLEGKSYKQMQLSKDNEEDYSEDYLKQTNVWKRLSKVLNEDITKSNVKFILPRLISKPNLQSDSGNAKENEIEVIENPFYIERVRNEKSILEIIKNPGCVVHIQAPPKFGKTWFMQRILRYAVQEYRFQTIYLNFNQISKQDLESQHRFFYFFCRSICSQLNETLEQKLQEPKNWSDNISVNSQCTNYLQYIFKNIKTPLVLGLDDIDTIFKQTDVASEFLPLIRNWCEQAQYMPVWAKLRIITARCEDADFIEINSSPFNLGIYPKLLDFNVEQIMDLAKKYNSSWNRENIEELMNLVGGHPELVKQALTFYKKPSKDDLENFKAKASTEESIYRPYLRKLLINFKLNCQNNPQLQETMIKILQEKKAIQVDDYNISDRLYHMGLISFEGNKVKLRYEIYRNYLTTHLKESN